MSNFEEISVILHVDSKSNISHFSNLPGNVIYTTSRTSVHWGHFSQVLATIELMRTAIKRDFDYFSLLSGDDFFLGSLDRFNDFVGKAQGVDFIDAVSGPTVEPVISRLCGMQYDNSTYLRSTSLPGRVYRRIIRETNWFLNGRSFQVDCLPTLGKGCNWFTVSRDFIIEFLDFFDKHQAEIFESFSQSLSSDEIVFASFATSHRPHAIASHSMDLGEHGLAALRYVDWTSSKEKPKVLQLDEISDLRRAEGIFFVRKVNRFISVEELNALR